MAFITRLRQPRDRPRAATEPAGEPRARRRAVRRAGGSLLTASAALLVLFALVAPNDPDLLTPGAFLRIPVEGLVLAALLLTLPWRAARIVAVAAGALLSVVTVLKVLDMGFLTVVVRPFDVILDWVLLEPAWEYLYDSYGAAGAIGAAVLAVAAAVAVLALTPPAVLRLARIAARHRARAGAGVAVLAGLSLVLALAGRPITPETAVAAFAYDRVQQARIGLHDREAFAAEAAVDDFRAVPPDRLLSELQGKDVVVAFVESYGRDAVEDPEFAPRVGALLDDGTRRLRAAGFASRSAYLTSPTFGGRCWLAQATFLSGLWIDNQQRYRNLVSGDRMTLPSAFRRAKWRTVTLAPGVRRAWPEASFFRFNRVYASWDLRYRGSPFSWARVPDQFTLAAFERLEHARKNRPQVMATIPLVSSHVPWTPLPSFLPWDRLGDGRVYTPMAKAGPSPKVWRSPAKVREDYRRAIEYSLTSLISYIETYGDDDLVVVFLGDHQPLPSVTGRDATHDVPISIVARDPAVLDRISSWGWTDGLRPGPGSPVWRMDGFRDRFLAAFSSPGGR